MTAPPETAPYLAAVALLGAAGAAKLIRPADTARALRIARMPASRLTVRLGAAAELAICAAAIIDPGPTTAALVAASYLAFAVFVAHALRAGLPLATCGCFGRPDSRPNRAHVVLNLAAFAAAAVWAASAHVRLGLLLSDQPWRGVPLLLVTAVIAGLAYLVWTNPLRRTLE